MLRSLVGSEMCIRVISVDVDFEEDRNELNCRVTYLILGLSPKFDDITVAFKP